MFKLLNQKYNDYLKYGLMCFEKFSLFKPKYLIHTEKLPNKTKYWHLTIEDSSWPSKKYEFFRYKLSIMILKKQISDKSSNKLNTKTCLQSCTISNKNQAFSHNHRLVHFTLCKACPYIFGANKTKKTKTVYCWIPVFVNSLITCQVT